MSDESLRKTYQFKLKPTPEQERQLAGILWQCRRLYNTALEQRFTLYRHLVCVQRSVGFGDSPRLFVAVVVAAS